MPKECDRIGFFNKIIEERCKQFKDPLSLGREFILDRPQQKCLQAILGYKDQLEYCMEEQQANPPKI